MNEFYEKLNATSTDSRLKSIKLNRLHKPLQIEGLVNPRSVDAGDIVEVVGRDGTVKGFGLVTFSTACSRFDYLGVNGQLLQGKYDEVSFAIRGVLPVLPSKQYDHAVVVSQLQSILLCATTQVSSVLPLLAVVHSQLCSGDMQPRAVDFEHICRRLHDLQRSGPTSSDRSAVDRLSVYFALAYHTLYFVRMPRSPFAAVGAQTMNAVNKIMFALTQIELEHGSSQLLHGTRSDLARTLQTFLNHWALWNDSRLARAAEAVLESCDGRRRLDSQRALSSALANLPNVTLFPWASSDPQPPQTKQTQQQQQQQKVSIIGRHAFTSNLVWRCTYFSSSVGASINVVNGEIMLSIFIPIVPCKPSPLAISSTIGLRARTVKLGATTLPLLPSQIMRSHEFELSTPRQSLRLSVQLDEEMQWKEGTVRFEACEAIPVTHTVSPQLEKALQSIEPIISDHELQLPQPTEDQIPELIDDEDMGTAAVGVVHAQSAAGRMAGLYMQSHNIEAPFLATDREGVEKVTDRVAKHGRIGVDAYVPISRPFDSSLALLAQQQLVQRTVPKRLFGGGARTSLVTKLQQTVLPQLRLLAGLELRDLQYWTLMELQQQLREAVTFHIFRCTLLESSAIQQHQEGQILPAFCFDLGIRVEVFVPAHTEQVFYGDQVIGTEILELDPLQGLFIVSM